MAKQMSCLLAANGIKDKAMVNFLNAFAISKLDYRAAARVRQDEEASGQFD